MAVGREEGKAEQRQAEQGRESGGGLQSIFQRTTKVDLSDFQLRVYQSLNFLSYKSSISEGLHYLRSPTCHRFCIDRGGGHFRNTN